MEIQKGVTHCDTIGDIFRNPILLKIIREWYKIKYEGKKLQIRKQKNGGKRNTSEFNEFIRSIFEDNSAMATFLDYVRERVLTSENITKKLFGRVGDEVGRKYSNQDIIKVLLAFEELHNQLANVTRLTVSGVFQTRVTEIITKAMQAEAHSEEDVYDSITLYHPLEQTLQDGVFPITFQGEIICKIADGVSGHIVNIVGRDEIFEVDKLGNPSESDNSMMQTKGEDGPDTRIKIVNYIRLLERILRYHISDDFEISEDDEKIYTELSIDYEKDYLKRNKIPLIGNEGYLSFTIYIQGMIQELEVQLKKTKPSDLTKIDSISKQGLPVGIQRDLPSSLEGTPVPDIKIPNLKIV